MAKAKPVKASGPKAYSYIRFSTPEQALGDSERRQMDLARRFAEREGLVLDDSLNLVDRGLSAYSGKNLTQGALGAFLEMVKSGQIAKGSLLIVENLDRISRQGFAALYEIIRGFVKSGVEVQILQPEKRWNRESIEGDDLIFMLVDGQRAKSESRAKSDRGTANWANKVRLARESRKPLTRLAPEWFKKDRDGRYTAVPFEPIPEAVRTIKQIFKWRSEGVGIHTIVRSLNDGTWWKPPGRKRTPSGKAKVSQPPKGETNDWGRSYVSKLLSNRALLGEYQPHKMVTEELPGGGKFRKRVPVGEVITDYFPAVISPGLFERVQKTLQRGKGGQTGKFRNILRHLAVCPYCGGSMTWMSKGDSPKGGQYLICERGSRTRKSQEKCQRNAFRYEQIETLILDNCPKLDPSLIVPSSDEIEAECRELEAVIADVVAKLSDVTQQIENFLDQIGRTSSASIRDRLEARIAALEAEQSKLVQDQIQLTEKLETTRKSFDALERWQKGMELLREKIKGEDPVYRQKLNHHLRELLTKVEVYSRGYPKLTDYDDIAKIEAFGRGLPKLSESGHPSAKAAPSEPAPTKANKRRRGKKPVKAIFDWTPPMTDDILFELDAMAEAAGVKRTAEIRAFEDEVAARRLSKDGRFIRVHFVSGRWVDLVPPGSLASGVFRKEVDGRLRWVCQAPDLKAAWVRFLCKRAGR